jgi:hypothetical protein
MDGKMATILLVYDDRMILEFCDHVLAGLSGFYVLQADSGDEALDTAARHSGTTYYLSAQPDSSASQRFSIEFLNDLGQRASEEETTTYFPAALAFAGARPIALKAGQEVSGLTITLQKMPLRHISGRVGGPAPAMMVFLNPQSDGLPGTAIPIKPDGSFERSGLLPGKYSVELRGQLGDHLLAEQEVNVKSLAGVG